MRLWNLLRIQALAVLLLAGAVCLAQKDGNSTKPMGNVIFTQPQASQLVPHLVPGFNGAPVGTVTEAATSTVLCTVTPYSPTLNWVRCSDGTAGLSYLDGRHTTNWGKDDRWVPQDRKTYCAASRSSGNNHQPYLDCEQHHGR